jgi:hypothetical protein
MVFLFIIIITIIIDLNSMTSSFTPQTTIDLHKHRHVKTALRY